MAFEIIMLMAAVAGECGCFQLIPCNLFFYTSLHFFSLSVFGQLQSFGVFNVVAGAAREVWTLELGVNTPFLSVGGGRSWPRQQGHSSDWSAAQATEDDRDRGGVGGVGSERPPRPGSPRPPGSDPPGFHWSPAPQSGEALFCTPLSRPGRASVPAAAALWTLTPRL